MTDIISETTYGVKKLTQPMLECQIDDTPTILGVVLGILAFAAFAVLTWIAVVAVMVSMLEAIHLAVIIVGV